MSAAPLERWLTGLRDRKIEDTDVSDEFCTRVRLWAELTPHLPADQAGAWLLYKEAEVVRAVLLDREQSVGRGTEADVVVNCRWMSRRHFVIRPVPEGFELECLDGKNALLLNRCEVRRQALRSGDVITVADQHYLFAIV